MPRKRMISPDIWTDPKFVSLTDDTTRLLFIGLFSNANDYGKLRGEWWSIRSMVFPINELPQEKIESMLGDLEKRDLIARYKVKDEKYIKLANWEKHQIVSHPAKDQFPDPSSGDVPESVQRPPQQLVRVKLVKVKLVKVKLGEYAGTFHEILDLLKTIKGYPFDLETDLDYLIGIWPDFEMADIPNEVKKWRVWLMDNKGKLGKKPNYRLRLRHWLEIAKKRLLERKASEAKEGESTRRLLERKASERDQAVTDNEGRKRIGDIKRKLAKKMEVLE